MHTAKPHMPLCCSARWFHKQMSLPAAHWLVGFTCTFECAVFPQLGWSRQSHKKHESERLIWTLNWPFAIAASIVAVIIRWLYVRHASAFQVYLVLVEEKQDAKSVTRISSWHWHGILSMWNSSAKLCWMKWRGSSFSHTLQIIILNFNFHRNLLFLMSSPGVQSRTNASKIMQLF